MGLSEITRLAVKPTEAMRDKRRASETNGDPVGQARRIETKSDQGLQAIPDELFIAVLHKFD